MRHFLVHTTVTPPQLDDDAMDALREQEIARAQELQRAGVLVVLWRESGRLASFGLWRGRDEGEVRDHLDTLPFRRYMSVELTEVERHPNALQPFPFDDACPAPSIQDPRAGR
ncbi:MAG: muconolactone Delta-isomerase family protein [Microcella sp.]|uniref:muconolactone Delta-isomerase family protein n=1 Tax=Microcella sp. TaxID=1913979 RepID=UPI003314C65C